MTRDDLRKAFGVPNVKAFQMVMRYGESSLTDDAYSMVNKAAPDDPARGVFNHRFNSYAKHPYEGMYTTEGGYACGMGQFIPTTWKELARKYGFTGFTPPEQDEGYVGCLVKRGALEDVIAGRFDTAVAKCRLEWTSLPSAGESNPNWTMAKARALYQKYGGSFDDGVQAPAPVEDRSTYQGKPTMDPLSLIAIFGPIISQLIPTVAKLFDRKAETPEKLAAAQTAIDVFTKAALPNKVNASGAVAADVAVAVENAKADPALLEKITQKVLMEPAILSILEVGGGVVKAREFDTQTQAAEKPFYKTSAVFWVSIMLLPIVYWLVGSLIVGGVGVDDIKNEYLRSAFKLFGTAWNGESRSGGFNLVIGLILGGICGVYYGVSVTQTKQQQQQSGASTTGG